MGKCPFCQKDIEAGVDTCPHCKKSLDVASIVQHTLTTSLSPVVGDVKKVSEENVVLKTKLDAAEKRLEKIEKMPAFNAPVIITREVEYKGYKLDKALSGDGLMSKTCLRDVFLKGGFGALSKEENIEKYAKNVIDIVHALKHHDSSAIENLRAIQKTNALNEATAAEGGYLVAPEYQWDIIKLARNRSYMLQLARVKPMISNVQYFPTEASLGTVTWENEAATKTPVEPTFGQVQLTAKKAFAMARITNEELADNSIDLVGLLTEQFAYSTGQELDKQCLTGTGSPFSGVLSKAGYSCVLTAGASFSTISASDLSLAISKLLEARLEGAVFLTSRLAKHYVRSLLDKNNRPIFALPGMGVPGTIYEYPYYQCENLSNTDGASAKMMIFGNFNFAILGRRQGLMNIDIDPYGMFDSDATRFRMITRWGFGVADANAFVVIQAAGA
jgi:HK97 family phage major capsid protein